MTQDQLKAAVLALGFERDFDDERLFMPSLTRALHTLYSDRPVTRTVKMSFCDAGAHELSRGFMHLPGERESYPILGRAFAFSVSGKGSYTVGEGDSAVTEDFDTDMTVIKGQVTPPSVITFSGEYAFSVYSLTSVKHLLGPEIKDIPAPGRWQSIDLSKRYGDYLAPESAPKAADGRTPEGCGIRSGILRVPSDFTGELYLTYRRRPTAPTAGIGDEVIDVPAETEELLPLLVASYLWLDDSPDKAQYYLALYREGIAGIRSFSARQIGSEYVTDGWA